MKQCIQSFRYSFNRGIDRNSWLSVHYLLQTHWNVCLYRSEVLAEITQLELTPFELVESLEQPLA